MAEIEGDHCVRVDGEHPGTLVIEGGEVEHDAQNGHVKSRSIELVARKIAAVSRCVHHVLTVARQNLPVRQLEDQLQFDREPRPGHCMLRRTF